MLVIVIYVNEQEVRSISSRVWGQRIRTLRKSRYLTQQDLADAIAASTGDTLHRSAVAHWETGRHEPALRHRRAIAVALGCPADLLFEVPAEVTAA